MQGDREKCLAAGMDDYIAKPVRLEDVRAIVERWGPAAVLSEPAPSANGGPDPTPVIKLELANGLPAPSDEGPVEMERLLDFTDGNLDSLRELVTLYLDQTSQQLEQLDAATKAGDAPAVRRLAHSCAGASATCGIRRLVPLLRDLERQSAEGQLANAPQLAHELVREFERVRNFLEAYLARPAAVASKN
jgi:HPt (histidine-containing phosphotransfer) domain-containing protein